MLLPEDAQIVEGREASIEACIDTVIPFQENGQEELLTLSSGA
jgi:hypothetical protein